jgi:hypothetical protein
MGQMLRAAAVVVGSSSLMWGCGAIVGLNNDYHEVSAPDAGDGESEATSEGASGDGAGAPDAGYDCTPLRNACVSSNECCTSQGSIIVCNGRKQCNACSSTSCNATADCCPNHFCHANGQCETQACVDVGSSCAAGGTASCCVNLVCFPNTTCELKTNRRAPQGDRCAAAGK